MPTDKDLVNNLHDKNSEPECAGPQESLAAPLAPHILVVDDDPLICQQLKQLFTHEGYRVKVESGAEQALQLLQDENIDLVVTDIRLPGMNGIELTKRVVERWNDVPIIVMTGYADIDNAVEALKSGASDYIVKPFGMAAIQESARVVLEKTSFFAEIRQVRRELKDNYVFGGMVSRSPEIHRVFDTIRTVAPTDSTVVLEGETGTGKELMARTIHHQSFRRSGPFITINCGGFPETLLESELFGYERGAFTGAEQTRPGKVELAHEGTLFLDEIENMPLAMQVKLLLVLNDQKVQRLGSSRWTKVNMRVVAASNIPLKELLDQGKLRRDFYYRINVISISLLPLRRRLDDIPLLIKDFLQHHPVSVRKKITGVLPDAMEQIRRYPWPGNIRELHNVLEKAVIMTKSRVLNAADLDLEVLNHTAPGDGYKRSVSTELSLNEWIREREKEYLTDKLKACRGRIDLTAKSCGVDVRTIHRKLQIYGLDKKAFGKPDIKGNVRPQRDH
jgi:DNA-binding NtrC family response regulator